MWFFGLIVGALIGAVGDFHGALIGAIVGAMAGMVLSGKLGKGANEARIATLEDAVRVLNARVKHLESRRDRAAEEASRATAVAAPEIQRVETAPVPEPVPVADAISDEPAAPPMRPDTARAPTGEPALSRPLGRAPVAPREPSALWRFFFGGNTLVRVGILVLFFGVAFLLKYAADQGLVPIEVRLAGVALGGIALLLLGWRLRHRREGYALML